MNKLLPVIVIFLLATFPRAAAAEPDPEGRRPNVVFLLADDLGWTGLKCFGSDLYETPHLDRLAEQGTRFTAAYSACTVCSPTRAALLTGLHPARLRLTDFIAGQHRPWARMRVPDWTKRLSLEHPTLARLLKQSGYATAMVGKWHLAPRSGGAVYQPAARGFDFVATRPAEARGYFLPEGFNRDGESGSDYLTDYLTDRAVEFIDRHRDEPFFLYFAFHAPHTPIQGRPDLVETFRSKVDSDSVHKNAEYAAMVHGLDLGIGRVLERLKEHDVDRDTIVIFTSDNGGLTQRYGRHDGFTENLPLRRGKGSAYEGGVRVPAIVRWPRVTQPGGVVDEPIVSMDFLPTLLEATSTPSPSTVDGRSLVSLLRDPETTLDRSLFWHYPHYHAGGDGPYSAVRDGRWRLIEFHEDERAELYDLREDPGESTDLADRMPERRRELLERLRSWRRSIGAQMPSVNPDFDPRRATEVARPAPGPAGR